MRDIKFLYSTHNDLPAIKKLWESVFKDHEIFIDQFFHHLYQDNILIAKIEDEIVAMATLLPATFISNGKKYSMRYVYACATALSFRGQKIMSKILDKAFEDTVNKGEAGLFLLPSNDELYDFYRKNGFQEFFYHDTQEFLFSDFAEKKCDTYSVRKILAKEYFSLRNSYLQNKDALHYPLSHFQFLDDAKINYPAKFYEILCEHKNVAIGFIEKNREEILVREFLCKEFNTDMLYAISLQFEYNKILLHTPGKTYRDAMLRSEKKLLFEKGATGYFNFALD